MGHGAPPMLLTRPVDRRPAVGLRVDGRAGFEQPIDHTDALVDCRSAQGIRALAFGQGGEIVGGEIADACRLDDGSRLGAVYDE